LIRLRLPGRPAAPPPRTGIARLLEDERFVRGLGLGALIGAAIAGSTLWTRRHDAERPEASHGAGVATHESPGITR
jgi:hypothetical protein